MDKRNRSSKNKKKSVQSTMFDTEPVVKTVFVSTELKYALTLWAARETKRLKADYSFEKDGHQCIRNELAIQTLRAQLIKKGILNEDHLVVKGRQERWVKAMEFGLGEAAAVGFFIKGGGDWSTTKEFDEIEASMTEKKFMLEILRRLEAKAKAVGHGEEKTQIRYRKMGLITKDFTNDPDDYIEIFRLMKENGKVRIILDDTEIED